MSSNKRTKVEKPKCQICDELLNESKRKKVSCPYCGFDACRTCCETYLLNESIPKCMNNECNREWTRQHISSRFTHKFIITELKKHKEELLFNQEKALLPATQPIVEDEIRKEKILYKITHDINEKIRLLLIEKRILESELYSSRNRPVNQERAEFVMACPDSDCRGYLSTQWKCGLCNKWACPDCHQNKGLNRDAEHSCNPDDVATAELLARDTKNCPNCRYGIFKIEGCDEMFCTQCNTTFNWRTGRIQDAGHNPHYFEWLRRNGNEIPRNPGDVPCEQRNLTHNTFITINRLIKNQHTNHTSQQQICGKLEKIIRNTIHVRFEERRNDTPNNIRRNEKLRVKYMRKRITEDEFKNTLQRDDKKFQKNREINNVYEILTNTITDIIFRFLDVLQNSNTLNAKILKEVDPIVQYVNECLVDISKTYSCKLRLFDNDVKLVRNLA
jgi:hypothetical protein